MLLCQVIYISLGLAFCIRFSSVVVVFYRRSDFMEIYSRFYFVLFYFEYKSFNLVTVTIVQAICNSLLFVPRDVLVRFIGRFRVKLENLLIKSWKEKKRKEMEIENVKRSFIVEMQFSAIYSTYSELLFCTS